MINQLRREKQGLPTRRVVVFGREAVDGIGKMHLGKRHVASNILDLDIVSMFINVKSGVTQFMKRMIQKNRRSFDMI